MDVGFLHCSRDIGKMTLIRLCAAQKEVVGDEEGKGMKEKREEVMQETVLVVAEVDQMTHRLLQR